MFKKFVAGCSIGLMVFSASSAFAENHEAKQPMSEEEASISDVIIGQLLDSVDKASVDFEVNGTFESDKGFILDGLTLNGLLKFNSDWKIDIGEKRKSSTQLKKVMPVIKMDAKNLVASAKIMATSDIKNIDLDFFERYDAKKGWLRRPLTLSISNQFNKSLITIRFNWLKAIIISSQDSSKPNQIKGSCYSEKILTDFQTGKPKTVPVQCEFDGYYSDKGHKINFKYVNRDSTVDLKP